MGMQGGTRLNDGNLDTEPRLDFKLVAEPFRWDP